MTKLTPEDIKRYSRHLVLPEFGRTGQLALKDAKVLADEVLPAFARELEKDYGVENLERVENLAGATATLKNEWTDFVRNLKEGSAVLY